MKTKRPQFFAMYKDFNSGKMKTFDVLECVFNSILTTKGEIRKKDFYILDDDHWERVEIRTKEQCKKFIDQTFRYHFWAKCEWEFIALDWPCGSTINDSRPIKIDVYDQLEPNLQLITDLVWNYIEPKINKLIERR